MKKELADFYITCSTIPIFTPATPKMRTSMGEAWTTLRLRGWTPTMKMISHQKKFHQNELHQTEEQYQQDTLHHKPQLTTKS